MKTEYYFELVDDETNEVIDKWNVDDPLHLQLMNRGDTYITNNGIIYSVVETRNISSVEKNSICRKLYSLERTEEELNRIREINKWERRNAGRSTIMV